MQRLPYDGLLIVLLATLLSAGPLGAETLDRGTVAGFTAQCWGSGDFDLQLKFAPVKAAAAAKDVW